MTIFNPGSLIILKGWRELDGPQLWHFSLTGSPRPLAASPPPPPTLPPPPPDPGSRVSSAPTRNILNITKLADQESCASHINIQPLPSQGINTTNAAGEDLTVYYLYGVAQAIAMAAQSSITTFNPGSLDLPSIGALVGFYHAKQTWLEAIKAGNCNTFDGLTYSNVARYSLDSNETILGHLAQQRQSIRSTKPKVPKPTPSPDLPPMPSSTT